MLSLWFSDPIQLSLAQAAVAAFFVLLVVGLLHWQSIHLEKEILIALVRSFLQITLVGSMLVFILKGPMWLGILILIGMMISATVTAAGRTSEIPNAFRATLFAIFLGSGVVIAVMAFLGAIDWNLSSLIPVGSMIVSGGMNSCALALDRFKGDVQSHVDEIETGLALGAKTSKVVNPYVHSALRASLLPRINSMRSLGIVWIPGLMSGMLLAGSDPVSAGIYQFVVMSMLFVASSLSSLISLVFVRKYIFTDADQLILRKKEQVEG